jgi:hypothetical protein
MHNNVLIESTSPGFDGPVSDREPKYRMTDAVVWGDYSCCLQNRMESSVSAGLGLQFNEGCGSTACIKSKMHVPLNSAKKIEIIRSKTKKLRLEFHNNTARFQRFTTSY